MYSKRKLKQSKGWGTKISKDNKEIDKSSPVAKKSKTNDIDASEDSCDICGFKSSANQALRMHLKR